MKKLPNAEFEIMKVIWRSTPPISTNQIIAKLDAKASRKPQTILTLLVRLIDRGFLVSEKNGKERTYSPIIAEKDYLQFETGDFIDRYYNNSLTDLVSTLYDGKNLTDSELESLSKWIKERG
ncbi:MAG: BlaI/MecI/CopY family transcriptional regulator [Lachnoclostridium sp.]|jgi:predicted transcriptional regulator|nr:BlaI/MecI/CopY family transcriptional regulator [Lachnoclostridium sp.]